MVWLRNRGGAVPLGDVRRIQKMGYPSSGGTLMLGSHYGILSIDSKSHRQKGRSRVDACLQKLVLQNYLRAVTDEVNIEKEMLETFIYA